MLRGDARAGHEYADQVERIARAQAHDLAVARAAADTPERIDCLGERVLLAEEARDESPAPQEAARLTTPEGARDVAPGQREALARRDLLEGDAVARDELGRDPVRQLVVRLGVRALEERPPSLDRAPPPGARRRQELAQRLKAVAGDESAADEIPQRGGKLAARQARRRGEIVEEERAA